MVSYFAYFCNVTDDFEFFHEHVTLQIDLDLLLDNGHAENFIDTWALAMILLQTHLNNVLQTN